MEYTFIEGSGKSTNNIIYISPKNEISKDHQATISLF